MGAAVEAYREVVVVVPISYAAIAAAALCGKCMVVTVDERVL